MAARSLAPKDSTVSTWRSVLEAACERGTNLAVAAKLDVSEMSVRRWLAGADPSAKMQRRILATLVVTPPAAAPPPVAAPPSLAQKGLTNRDRMAGIVERLEREIASCDDTVPRNHLAALYGQLQAAVAKLSRLDGEGELTVAALLRSRAWAEVEAVILEVLRRHAGAAEDLVAALDAVRDGAG